MRDLLLRPSAKNLRTPLFFRLLFFAPRSFPWLHVKLAACKKKWPHFMIIILLLAESTWFK